jgi:hypothetical protein
MKKIKSIALLCIALACMTSMYAMLTRRVMSPQVTQSYFSRIMNSISAWRKQLGLRWYRTSQPVRYPRITTPILKLTQKPKIYYLGPQYDRTEDWIKEHPFGQKVAQSLKASKYTNQGKRLFKVIEEIEDCDGFKKGDFIVVDAFHKDHLEVFNKLGKWIGVANFDGTKNNDKTLQGKKEARGSLAL